MTIKSRRIVDSLVSLRKSRGLSQQDLAEKMRCTQSRVSKLETGIDDQLYIADIREYCLAIGVEYSVSIEGSGEIT